MDNWISVKKPPQTAGNYLCITNDDKIMVCYVTVLGIWSKVPDASYYGDMGEMVVIDSKRVDREVIKWRILEDLLPKN